MNKFFRFLCERLFRCVLPIAADVQRQYDAERFLNSDEFQRRQEQETIKGEWHRSEENAAKLEWLLVYAFGSAYRYAIAHHIVVMQPGKQPYEIASVETLLFDRFFLCGLTGESALLYDIAYTAHNLARAIAILEQQERLDFLYQWKSEREKTQKGLEIC